MGSLTDLPPELVAGWALWLAGGLALMIWFRRRSAAMTSATAGRPAGPVGPVGPPPAVRRSGVPAAAPAAVTAASAPSAAVADDALAELHALLDGPVDPPASAV